MYIKMKDNKALVITEDPWINSYKDVIFLVPSTYEGITLSNYFCKIQFVSGGITHEENLSIDKHRYENENYCAYRLNSDSCLTTMPDDIEVKLLFKDKDYNVVLKTGSCTLRTSMEGGDGCVH